MAAFVRRLMSIAAIAVAAGCASATSRDVASTVAASEKTIRIEARDGGWKFGDLFDLLHDEASVSLLYDSCCSTFKNSRVFVGPYTLRDEELFPWLQAIAADRHMTLVRFDGPRAVGRRQWFLLDQDQQTAIYVEAADVASYATRAGLRIATWFPTKVRDGTALGVRVAERVPGLDRCQDVPGSAILLVSGPAPAVAAAQREVYRLDAEARRDERPVAPPIDRTRP